MVTITISNLFGCAGADSPKSIQSLLVFFPSGTSPLPEGHHVFFLGQAFTGDCLTGIAKAALTCTACAR